MDRAAFLPFALVAGFALPAAAQQMDMEAMQRWGNAKVIYYSVEGVHNGASAMTATMGGVGDVVDRVSMTFEWNLAEAKLVKVTSLRNFPSEVKNLRDREPKCLPPVLKGPYEEMTVLEVANGLGGAIDMKTERSYPAVDVAQFCTASRKPIAADKKTTVKSMAVPSPMVMAMGMPASDRLSYSADRKSLVVKDGNWTWTFTPSTTPPAR